MMKQTNILCYGDSNTYGFNPANGLRYDRSVRWTGVLKELLGEKYNIIEEGCNGRTTVFRDPVEGWKNGYDYLKPCLNSHKPVDIFIMMLGSNDLKTMYGAGAKESADGAEVLIREAIAFTREKQGFVPVMILIAPPLIGEAITFSSFGTSFDFSAHARSTEFGKYYKEVAERCGCLFLDAAQIIRPSEIDSLHLSEEAHATLARALGEIILTLDHTKAKS